MAGQYFNYPNKILVDNFKKNIDNLIITNTGDSSRLIKDSVAVIGLNSTTLVEAIIADKVIIMPYFGDIINNQPWSFFDQHPALIKYAKNLKELENYILLDYSDYKYDEEIKKDFLEKYISTSIGNASLRAENEIIKEINKFNK